MLTTTFKLYEFMNIVEKRKCKPQCKKIQNFYRFKPHDFFMNDNELVIFTFKVNNYYN